MKLISLNVPERDLELIKGLIDVKLYPNKSEFIRYAIKKQLEKEAKKNGKKN